VWDDQVNEEGDGNSENALDDEDPELISNTPDCNEA
jgi:hypothetical protein